MRIIVPVTMFGSVLMPCFVYARCIGKGLYYLLFWSQYLVTFPRNLVSSCRFTGQVRRRVGDLSLFRVWSVLNWCTVLVKILVCGNAVRSQAHSSCLILACEM